MLSINKEALADYILLMQTQGCFRLPKEKTDYVAC